MTCKESSKSWQSFAETQNRFPKLPNGELSCVHCCCKPVQQYRIKNRSGVMGKLEPWSKLPNPDEFMQRATRTGVLGECTIVRCLTGQKNCQCSNLGCQQNLKSPDAHWQEHQLRPYNVTTTRFLRLSNFANSGWPSQKCCFHDKRSVEWKP